MFERRPLLGLLIGITICVSIWRISVQEAPFMDTETNYHPNQFQQHLYHRHFVISSTAEVETQLPRNASVKTSKDDERNVNGNSQHSLRPNSNRYIAKLYSHKNIVSSPNYLSSVNLDLLQKNDLNRLINLNNFSFLINQKPCSSSATHRTKHNLVDGHDSPLTLILVHSAPSNYMKRLLIRETWGSLDSPYIRLLFLLGAVNSTKIQHQLEMENKMFADVVQGNFIDAYRNMTYKHVMALKWFTFFCPNVKFILKIDDDVFVNTPYLIDFLNRQAPQHNFLFCQKELFSRVKRSYRSKWRVSPKEFPARYYPPYCPGYAILYSPDVAFRLYQKAQENPYFWIDDVHITGTLAQKANITITPFSSFVLDKNSCNSLLSVETDKNSFRFLFTWPDIPEEQSRTLWNLIENLK